MPSCSLRPLSASPPVSPQVDRLLPHISHFARNNTPAPDNLSPRVFRRKRLRTVDPTLASPRGPSAGHSRAHLKRSLSTQLPSSQTRRPIPRGMAGTLQGPNLDSSALSVWEIAFPFLDHPTPYFRALLHPSNRPHLHTVSGVSGRSILPWASVSLPGAMATRVALRSAGFPKRTFE